MSAEAPTFSLEDQMAARGDARRDAGRAAWVAANRRAFNEADVAKGTGSLAHLGALRAEQQKPLHLERTRVALNEKIEQHYRQRYPERAPAIKTAAPAQTRLSHQAALAMSTYRRRWGR